MLGAESDSGALNRIRQAARTDVGPLQPLGTGPRLPILITTGASGSLTTSVPGWLASPGLNLVALLAMPRRGRCFRALQSASLGDRCGQQDSRKYPSRPLPRY